MRWAQVPLGKICRFVNGGTPSRKMPQYFDGTIPWITGADIGDFCITEPREYITQEAIENSATHLLPKGTVLLVTRTGVGKVAVAPFGLCISQDLTGVIPEYEIINSSYLARYLGHRAQYFKALQRGATIQGITRQVVSSLEIPLPPLSEQQRIVEILDQADALRKKRAEADVRAERILPALFLKMFGDPATNPMGWDRVPIGEVSSLVTSGFTPRGGEVNYVKEGPYFLRSQNIRMNCLDLSDVACLPIEIHEAMSRTKVHFGDVLLNITGASIGRVAWYDISDHEANVNQHVCIIRLTENAYPDYISYFLSTSYGQVLIDRAQTGTTRQGLNHENVRRIEVILPHVDAQKEFASGVRSYKHLAVKRVMLQEKINKLFQILLHHAFTGNLTAQWREGRMKELLEEMEEQAKALNHLEMSPC